MKALSPTTPQGPRPERGSTAIRLLVALIGLGLMAGGFVLLRTHAPSPGSFYADIDSRPESGLELSREVGDDPEFCCAIGRHSMILGREDGSGIEGWDLPFQAFYDLEIRFEAHGKRLSASKIVVRPEATFLYFGKPPLQARAVLLAPVSEHGGCILFESLSRSRVGLTLSFVPALKMMWPGDRKRTEVTIDWDKTVHAFVLTDRDKGRTAVIGGGGTPAISTDDKHPERFRRRCSSSLGEVSRCRLQYVLRPGTNQALFSFAAGGSRQAVNAAFRRNTALFADQYDRTAAYYTDYLRRTPDISIGDADFERAFEWAKVGLDKCFIEIPGLGSCYAAGFDCAGCGFRPGYAWFFARDTVWMSFAACCIGEFDKAKASLDLLAKYQMRSGKNKGKIPHEIPATGEPIYSAGDASPLWVIGLYRYWEWTGDTGYLQEMWPQVVDALDWCYRQDTDGDLLMDNPPAGHEWYDFGGRNMIDLEAIWAKALASAASIAEVLSDRIDSDAMATAVQWADDARKVEDAIDAEFWNDDGGYFNLRQESHGVFDDAKTANAAFALLWRQVSPYKADRQLRTWQGGDMLTAWGVRTLSNRDGGYDPEGYHEGRVWPYVNGLVSLAAFAQGSGDFGYELLRANAKMVDDFALGWIPETVRGDRYEGAGAPLQGWSASMVIQPLVEGLAGIEPEEMTFSPSLAFSLDSITFKGLTVRGERYDVELTQGTPPRVEPLD
jgi:glycogen debranching enzyme